MIVGDGESAPFRSGQLYPQPDPAGSDAPPASTAIRYAARYGANPIFPSSCFPPKGEIFDKVLGLELGADDYMESPSTPKELVARGQSRAAPL